MSERNPFLQNSIKIAFKEKFGWLVIQCFKCHHKQNCEDKTKKFFLVVIIATAQNHVFEQKETTGKEKGAVMNIVTA